ncbi:alanine racemase [Metabacillus sp. RGM 3146]|uniref:alanine racemase n=1 Tax=Metabacillus sp. RGM 3146 TaxID=3401092 RepID=UPI003B9ACAEE
MNQGSFYRDTWVEINLDAIKQNVRNMKKHVGEQTKVIAVVKANAYGHGDSETAEAALSSGASMLAVAFLDEALSLREKGITAPILVLGGSRAADVQTAVDHHITLTVFSLDWLKEAMNELEKGTLFCHIKVDTGMGRLGFTEKEKLMEFISYSNSEEKVAIKGIYTHFATADELETGYFEKQFKRFNEMIEGLPSEDWMVHCGNSATGLRFPEKLFNAVRLGISMYGLSPSEEMKKELPYKLEEAFSLRTKLVQVKKIHKGDSVSYGATFKAEKDEWVGTLPIGYADGWIRKLKNSDVLIEGKRVPIIGRICMDQCMVLLPEEMSSGTEVTLIGKQENSEIPVDEVASRLETINYEVTCIIGTRVPRIYMENGRIVKVKNSLLS